MSDNFALRGLSDWFETHRDDLAFMHVVQMTRRVQVLVIDGQRGVDDEIAAKEDGPSVTGAVPALISNNVDQGNVASLSEMTETLDEIGRWLELRDYLVATIAWDRAKKAAGPSAKSLAFADWLKRGSYEREFEAAFQEYVNAFTVLEQRLAGASNEQSAQIARTELDAFNWQVRRLHQLRTLGDLYGSIKATGFKWDNIATRLGPRNEKELFAELNSMKAKLQELAIRRAGDRAAGRRPTALSDIVKISVADDCDKKRKDFLLASDTGLGLDPDIIFSAIESGRKVGERHRPLVRDFVQSGTWTRRSVALVCEEDKPTTAGAPAASTVAK
jgi:hypothetical protein